MKKNEQQYLNRSKAKISSKAFPVLYQRKDQCCGCSLCESICKEYSAGAIKMIEDKNGFRYPVVDLLYCVGCKRCMVLCPFKPKK